jgi:hypothetical protein
MADTSSKPLSEWERAHYVVLPCKPADQRYWLTIRPGQFDTLRRNMELWGEWPETDTTAPLMP